jgi:uncharacterized protein
VRAIVRALATAVRRSPVVVVVVSLVLTGVLGSFASQVEIDQGNEAFSPDNEEIAALETIQDLFGGETSERVFQVIVRDPGGDVISPEGVETALAVEQAIRAEAGDRLVESGERPGVVSFATPVVQAATSQGISPEELAGLPDDQINQFYAAALENAPPEQRGFITGLLSEGGDAGSAAAPGGLVLVFVETEASGSATDDLDAVIAEDEGLAEAVEAVDSDLDVRPFSQNLLFAGMTEFTSEVGRLFAFAGLIIVVILLFVYWLRPRGSATAAQTSRRTVVDMLLTMLTIFMAIGMMQGTGVLLERIGILDGFSPPTQIVPILIIGLGVDYAIHLTSRYREEVGEGSTVDDGMSAAITTVGVALVLATLTTVIGFLTNVFNPVPALKDFGILSAVGIFFSFVLMLTFVPAVRVLLDRRAERAGRVPVDAMSGGSERILPTIMGRTAVIAEHAPRTAIVLALVLGGLGFWGFSQLETRFSFTDFLPEDSPGVETLELIQEEFGGGFGEQTQVLVEALEGESLGAGIAHNALVEASSELAAVEDVTSFETPAGPVPNATSPISVIQQVLAQAPESAPPTVAEAAATVGLGPDLRVPDDADVAPLYRALVDAMPDVAGAAIHMDGDRVDAILFDIQTTAGETRVSELRSSLDDVFADVEVAGADAVTTSQNIIGDVVVEELTASQSSSLFLTLAVATLVLVAYFWFENRRPFLGVITMAPVALVVLWTYGLMYATGIPFGPVTATLAALAIGIGVPFTIHISRRFEEDRKEFDDLDDAIRSTATHTGGALAGSAFTTMAGFGILITSSLVPFRQMGQVTVYAIGLSLVAAILVLPSMLALWERWHRTRSAA